MEIQNELTNLRNELTKREKNILYQKEYYKNNKTELLEKLTKKCKCLLCGRVIIKNNVKKHQNSPICLRNRGNNEKTYEEIK